MKATIETAVLRRAAQRAARVASPKANIPILRNAMISAGKDKVTISANNLEYSISMDVAAAVEDQGMTCVSAHEFRAFCDIAPDGSQILIEVDGSKLRARSGTRRASFATLPGVDFPKPLDPVKPWKAKAEDVASAIRFAMPAASTEETRFYLCGVHLGDGWAVATNGHLLHAAPLKTDGNEILPSDHLPMMLDVLEREEAKFGASGGRWSVTGPGIALVGKCIDGSFPDWQRVVPEFERVARLHRDELADAVEAATLKGDGLIIVAAAADADFLTIDGTRDLGDASAECGATEAAEFRAPLAPGNLRDALSVLPSVDLALDCSGTLAVALRAAEDDGGRYCLIMQMRG